MRSRTLGLVAALVAMPTAAAAIAGPLAGGATTATSTSRSRAATTSHAATTSRWTPQRTTGTQRSTAAQRSLAKGGTATLVRVTVTTGNDDTGTDSGAPTRDAARRRVRAACTNPGPGTSAYNLSGSRVNGPTTAHLNPNGAPAAAASAFQAAFNTWKAADGNAPSIGVATDGTATSPSSNHRMDIMFKSLAGRTLAITYTWHWSTGEYESDMVFGTNVPWFQAAGEGDGCYEGVHAYDLQNTATHEAGHVYGLSHVSSAFNTMAPTASYGETYKRSLAPGDAAGIRAIY